MIEPDKYEFDVRIQCKLYGKLQDKWEKKTGISV